MTKHKEASMMELRGLAKTLPATHEEIAGVAEAAGQLGVRPPFHLFVGIDLSLTSTGLAIYDPAEVVPGGEVYTDYVKSKPSTIPGYEGMLERFQGIGRRVLAQFANYDVRVFLEGPAYGRAQNAHLMSGNWWLLYQLLHDEGCEVTVIPPSNVKQYATGKGNAAKDQVLAAAIKRYPDIDIPGNDVADAVILLAIGMRMAGRPLERDGLPATHLKALDKLVKP